MTQQENSLHKIMEELWAKSDPITEYLWYVNPTDIRQALQRYADERLEAAAEEVSRSLNAWKAIRERSAAIIRSFKHSQ